MRQIRLLSFFTIMVIVIIYATTVTSIKYEVFVDTWPLNNIVIETVTLLIAITLLTTYTFYTNRASILFTYIIVVFMVVYIPLLKYPNDLWLYGPWDSSAHYSFALWIVEKGYVPANYELFYSNQYGHHPGNGLLPGIFNIITQLSPLPVSMSIILLMSYMTYALLLVFLAIPTRVLNMPKHLLILSLLVLFTSYLPYYGGVELAYAYVALIAYHVISALSSKKQFTTGHALTLIITFLGLLITHLSTAIIIQFFLASILLGFSILRRYQVLHLGAKRLISILIVLGAIFLAYEMYVDVYLMGLSLRQGIQRIIELYIYELEITRRSMEYNPYISGTDLIIYLISQYTKNLIIVGGIGLYVLYYALKHRARPKKMRQAGIITAREPALFTLLLVSSLPTWIVGWFGVGRFMSGSRALPLIQFFFSINILYCFYEYEMPKAQGSSKQFMINLLSLILLSLGFISNYSVYLGPYITSLEGDLYTYPVWTQGVTSPFVLNSVEFLGNFLVEDSAYRFLCVEPYIGFGLCDLLWDKPKIPRHGFVRPELTASKAMIELLEKYTNVIIPVPTTDKVIAGPVGYTSFFREPLLHMTTYGKGVIYSNGHYVLILM